MINKERILDEQTERQQVIDFTTKAVNTMAVALTREQVPGIMVEADNMRAAASRIIVVGLVRQVSVVVQLIVVLVRLVANCCFAPNTRLDNILKNFLAVMIECRV